MPLAPRGKPVDDTQYDALSLILPSEPFPTSPFTITRRLLNERLVKIRRDQLEDPTTDEWTQNEWDQHCGCKRSATGPVDCRSVKWERIEDVYNCQLKHKHEEFPRHLDVLDSNKTHSIMEEIRRRQLNSGYCVAGDELHKYGMATIMVGAAELLGDEDIRVRFDVTLKDDAVFTSGTSDILVTRKWACRLVVAEARRYDFEQGRAKLLVLMEIAIFWIVTSRKGWHLFRYDACRCMVDESHDLESSATRVLDVVRNMPRER